MLSGCSQEQNARQATTPTPNSNFERISSGAFIKKARISKGNSFLPEEFMITADSQSFVIRMDGNISSGDRHNKLALEEGFYIVKMHYLEKGGNMLLFSEVEDGEISYTDVTSLNMQTLDTLWHTTLNGYNLSVGALQGDVLYIGAGGKAYALNMDSGKILWRTDGLREQYGFRNYDTLQFRKNELILSGKTYKRGQPERDKSITLEKTTGKILAVD
jgi:hypothetical protein